MIYEQLKKEGITIKGNYGAYPKGKKKSTQFGVVKSAKIAEIVRKMNYKSVNILAENLLQNSYKYSGSKMSLEDWAVDYLKSKLGVNTVGMKLFDGSGLSHFNAVSSKQLVELLIRRKENKTFKAPLPTAGVLGTVRSFLKNSTLNGNVKCKSGSMTGVKSYAGYVSNTSGKNFAFAIIVNDPDGSNSDVSKKIEALMNHIGGL